MGYLFGLVCLAKIMQKSTIATLTVLILMTMTLSSTLVGMSLEKEPVRSLTEEDGVCTSDGDCPDGFICSSTGECVKPQTCDANGDCSDGQICQDGVCIDNPDQEDGNGCESNEDCTDGQYCDENSECADDPTQDDSCTSDADCADGQICGAAGECMDAPDDSGNETNGNETNDSGDEPQYRNCSNVLIEDVHIDGLMVCDEETGEWIELEDTRPTSVEIGCDEEPTEEQLNATNLADLLNEHDEILIRDGDDTIRMRTMSGSDQYFKSGVERQAAMNDSNDGCLFPACRAWDAVDFEITPKSRVFLVDIENNHSRTEMVVIEEENATHVSIVFSSFNQEAFGTEGRSNSSSYDGFAISLMIKDPLSMNDHGGGIVIMVGNGDVGDLDGYTSSSNNTETQGRSNSTIQDGDHVYLRFERSVSNGTGWVHYAVVREGVIDAGYKDAYDLLSLSVYGTKTSLNGTSVLRVADGGSGGGRIHLMVESSVSAPNGASSVFYDDMSIGDRWHINNTDLFGLSVRDGNTLSSDNPIYLRGIQIGMDENGTVTNANIVRSITTDSGCLMAEDLESTNKDDGNEPEDESSNVLVAAGGVEVTTRDAVVAGVAAVITALLSAVIRRGGGDDAKDAYDFIS